GCGGRGAGAARRRIPGLLPAAGAPKRRFGSRIAGISGEMDDPLRNESSPRIDWESAEVSGGELRVAVAGEPPKGWGSRVGEVLERLAREGSPTRWGSVKVSRGRIVVKDLQDGAESDLRHEMESAVLQANADLDAAADAGADIAAASAEESRDERMTARFRDFARGG